MIAATTSVLFASVRRWFNAIVDSPDVQHHRAPIGDEHQNSPTRGRDRSQDRESDRRRGDEKEDEGAHYAVPFVNVTQTGNYAKQDRHRVAGFWLGRFRCFQRPIAIRAVRRVFRQGRAAIRALLRVPANLLGLSRRVGVFHQD